MRLNSNAFKIFEGRATSLAMLGSTESDHNIASPEGKAHRELLQSQSKLRKTTGICDYAIMTIVMSEKIPAGEFKAKCLKLIDEVQRLRMQVVITKHGKPVAKLVPLDQHTESFIGSMKGTMEIVGDIVKPLDVEWAADAE